MPGDAEGGTEMTGSMQLIREFCDLFVIPEKATRTRIVCLYDWISFYDVPTLLVFRDSTVLSIHKFMIQSSPLSFNGAINFLAADLEFPAILFIL